MDIKTIKAIEAYQCAGCVSGSDISCYKKGHDGVECSRHCAGTTISHIGRIFLGLPKGFSRLGSQEDLKIAIFESFDNGWGYNMFNVPVWKHLDDNGNTLVRGICPRINWTWIHIFIGDVMDKINCLEITRKDFEEMD